MPAIESTEATPLIRVVICEDEPDLLLMLRVLLTADPQIDVVGEAQNGQALVEIVASISPDVVVLDLSMPRMSGIEALPLLRERSPQTTIVAYTGLDPGLIPSVVLESSAVIEKGTPSRQLVQVVKSVATRSVP